MSGRFDLDHPPAQLFYAPGIAGKTGPFYMALRGVRSAFKTSTWRWHLKYSSQEQVQVRRRVWVARNITWEEITDQVAPSVEELMRHD